MRKSLGVIPVLCTVSIAAAAFILLFSLCGSAHALELNVNGEVIEYEGAIINISIDGVVIETEVPPVIFEGRTLVPARAVFEYLSADVGWDPEKREVKVQSGGRTIYLTIDNKTALVNGFQVEMEVPAMIINDRTFIPLRFVGESLGYLVDWHPDNDMVSVNTSTRITDIRLTTMKQKTQLVLIGDKKFENYKIEEDPEQKKIILEAQDAYLGMQSRKNEYTNDPYVSSIDISQYSRNPYKVRLELNMKAWTGYSVSYSADRGTIMVDFTETMGEIEQDEEKPFIEYSGENRRDIVLIRLESVPKFNAFRLTSPDRLVIDLPNTYNPDGTRTIPIDSRFIEAVRYAQFDETTTRVVLDLKNQFQYSVVQVKNGIRVIVEEPGYNSIRYVNAGDSMYLDIFGMDITGKLDRSMDINNKRFTVTISEPDVNLGNGKIEINDEFLKSIDIITSQDGKETKIVFNQKGYFIYFIAWHPDEGMSRIEFFKRVTGGRKLVVIDAGHGGTETGAVSGGVNEKDFNVDIALRLNALLQERGITTFMTREDDSTVDLYERPYAANELQATLFVSLHNNAAWSSNVRGTETLYNPDDNIQGFNGMRFAEIVQKHLIEKLGLPDRGIVPRPELVVLNQTRMPAVLVEFAFITNDTERELLLTPEFKQLCAEAVCEAIIEALAELETYE